MLPAVLPILVAQDGGGPEDPRRPDRTDVVAALARRKVADLLGNEVTDYRASSCNALERLTELVATWEPSRVVMETSAEAFRIADAVMAAGHEARVVPGTLVRLLGVGDRGVKNDQRDAQQLSNASWQTDVRRYSARMFSAHGREVSLASLL
jgi:transposase